MLYHQEKCNDANVPGGIVAGFDMHMVLNSYKIILGAVLVLVAGFFYMRQSGFFTSVRTYTVAVLTFDAPFFAQVTEGIELLKPKSGSNIAYKFIYFHGINMDKIALQAIVDEVFMSKPDVIISIGVTFSQLCVKTARKRGYKTPIVFAGPGKPLEQELVTALDSREEFVTGVALSPIDCIKQGELLLKCKPTLKSVVIPFNPTCSGGMLEQMARSLGAFLESHGIIVYILPIYQVNDTKSVLAPFMSKVDTVICLEGDTIDDVNTLLVKMCTQHNVTLFAKDLECVPAGAALGYGVYAVQIGAAAMKYADLILTQNIHPGTLPVLFIDKVRKLALNTNTAPSQGMVITPGLLRLADQLYR
jgi:ABC-type uncharacterized transport system substrate-binding protein